MISYAVLFHSCANQLPPSGGEDDKIPPKIISISPKPNTTNFRGNIIDIKFDEYVDRRSFEESFFISPKPSGEYSFSWSGKEVEIEFEKPFAGNKTYVIIIGNELKDVRGSNRMSAPKSYAFSTGSKIDEGAISGKVYSEINLSRVKVLLYQINDGDKNRLNPETDIADYIMQVSPDGNFEFSNLPYGTFRLFAITDEDRNNKFDKEIDLIAKLPRDLNLSGDSGKIENANVILGSFDLDKTGAGFLKLLTPDSTGFISSNIKKDQKNIPVDYRFYFYFKKNNLSKEDIVVNFSVADANKSRTFRMAFNWINDSLVEVFPLEKFPLASEITLTIDLTNTIRKLFYSINFFTPSKNNLGNVSGKIISKDSSSGAFYVRLYNKDNKFISYSEKLEDTNEFNFEEIVEGNYYLVCFEDKNGDGKIDLSKYSQNEGTENFIIYDNEIKVKGGWNVENVFLNF